ncbi:MAG: 6-carboxytetrahydropterin synthase QueD [Planctomycetota bacterium]
MRATIVRTFAFDAAPRLDTFPDGHKCTRVHGHTFSCDVVVEGEVDPTTGYILDFGELKAAIEPLRQRLDHHYLNDVEGLDKPTAELLAKWIYDRLAPNVPGLVEIVLRETPSNRVHYRGE